MGNLRQKCVINYTFWFLSSKDFGIFDYMSFVKKLENIIRGDGRRSARNKCKTSLSEFNRSISLIIDRKQLVLNIIEKIKQITHFKALYIYLLNYDFQRFELISEQYLTKKEYQHISPQNSNLIFWLKTNETYLVLSKRPDVMNFFSEKEQKLLKELDIDIIYPLWVMNKLRGIVLIQPGESKRRGKKIDMELLNILLDQTMIALENATLYEQQQERLRRMYRADRLAVIGQLAAGTAHEIRNPLASIRSTIQYLQSDEQDKERYEMFSGVINEVDRINEILQDLLSFSRPREPRKEQTKLTEIFNRVFLLVSNMVRKKGIQVEYYCEEEEPKIQADPAQLEQVFLNLVMNAAESLDKGGEITISLINTQRSEDRNQSEGYQINIEDNGPGIREEELEKIFDPFYTTKPHGTGLGLSIVYGIINKHGGDIGIESKVSEGTTVKIRLPKE